MYYFQNLFPTKFYWNVFISENEVKRHWLVKAAVKYSNFITKIKGEGEYRKKLVSIYFTNSLSLNFKAYLKM